MAHHRDHHQIFLVHHPHILSHLKTKAHSTITYADNPRAEKTLLIVYDKDPLHLLHNGVLGNRDKEKRLFYTLVWLEGSKKFLNMNWSVKRSCNA